MQYSQLIWILGYGVKHFDRLSPDPYQVITGTKAAFSFNEPLGTTEVKLNPLHAKFFRGNQNIYLHFMSFFYIDTIQVVEILLQVRQELTYSS